MDDNMPSEMDGENDTEERIEIINITNLNGIVLSSSCGLNRMNSNFSARSESFNFGNAINSTEILTNDSYVNSSFIVEKTYDINGESRNEFMEGINSLIADLTNASKKRRRDIDDESGPSTKKRKLRAIKS